MNVSTLLTPNKLRKACTPFPVLNHFKALTTFKICPCTISLSYNSYADIADLN